MDHEKKVKSHYHLTGIWQPGTIFIPGGGLLRAESPASTSKLPGEMQSLFFLPFKEPQDSREYSRKDTFSQSRCFLIGPSHFFANDRTAT